MTPEGLDLDQELLRASRILSVNLDDALDQYQIWERHSVYESCLGALADPVHSSAMTLTRGLRAVALLTPERVPDGLRDGVSWTRAATSRFIGHAVSFEARAKLFERELWPMTDNATNAIHYARVGFDRIGPTLRAIQSEWRAAGTTEPSDTQFADTQFADVLFSAFASAAELNGNMNQVLGQRVENSPDREDFARWVGAQAYIEFREQTEALLHVGYGLQQTQNVAIERGWPIVIPPPAASLDFAHHTL